MIFVVGSLSQNEVKPQLSQHASRFNIDLKEVVVDIGY